MGEVYNIQPILYQPFHSSLHDDQEGIKLIKYTHYSERLARVVDIYIDL